MKIIVDPGSCHMGKMEYAKEFIRVAYDCGVDAVKYQLFAPNSPEAETNIPLPYSWLLTLKMLGDEIGVEVFASAFDADAVDHIALCGCKSIKFAYGRPIILVEQDFENVYASGDIMNMPAVGTSLYCHAVHGSPVYPVVETLNFKGIFKTQGGPYDGFSSHCYDWRQNIEAAREGATVLECHMTLDKSDIDCPDNNFALNPKNVERMVSVIRGMA